MSLSRPCLTPPASLLPHVSTVIPLASRPYLNPVSCLRQILASHSCFLSRDPGAFAFFLPYVVNTFTSCPWRRFLSPLRLKLNLFPQCPLPTSRSCVRPSGPHVKISGYTRPHSLFSTHHCDSLPRFLLLSLPSLPHVSLHPPDLVSCPCVPILSQGLSRSLP